MPALTIRNLDPDIKARLRVRAAQEGRSMEEHVRMLIANDLASASLVPLTSKGLATQTRALFADMDFEFELPPRGLNERAPPSFE